MRHYRGSSKLWKCQHVTVGLLKKRAEWGERVRLFCGGRQILGVHLCIFVISTGCPILNGQKLRIDRTHLGDQGFPHVFFCFGLDFEIIANNPQFWTICVWT